MPEAHTPEPSVPEAHTPEGHANEVGAPAWPYVGPTRHAQVQAVLCASLFTHVLQRLYLSLILPLHCFAY